MPTEVVDPSEQWRALFNPGRLVDHFRIMRMVGRGGMGEVYLARDTKLGRKVALKVIHPEQIGSHGAAEKFLLEAQAMARFSHPNIVTVYAVGEHHKIPYVALEYLEGQTLRQRMREERPGVREALRFGLSIAEALREAHANKILHRDLKPENVLIPRDGRLRVVDFGLAKILGAARGEEELPDPNRLRVTAGTDLGELVASDSQKVSEVRGTPAYMAPEQWMEQEATAATDVWALGTVLYELVTGRIPYKDATVMELALRVCGPEPVPRIGGVQEAPEGVQEAPEGLRELVYRCLEKPPEQRPSAAEVADGLDQLLFADRGQRRRSDEVSPFRGLLAFSERHADFFHGRDTEITAFVERVREQPVLPVVGPSGAGKSSFVQAGVIPRMREQGSWVVLTLRPGRDPFGALAARLLAGASASASNPTADTSAHERREALAAQAAQTAGAHPEPEAFPESGTGIDVDERAGLALQLMESPSLLGLTLQQLAEREGGRVLLFVDQLEEIYTLVQEERVRRGFMEAICGAADDPQDPVRVIFTLRDDFLVRLAEGAEVREALSHVTVIANPGPEALKETLVRPLETVGYRFDDPDLAHEMVDAVQGEPAALPLLQFVTRQIWDQRDRDRRRLTRATYDAAGGVGGALAKHADGVLEGLAPDQVQLARDLLLRLVTAEGTRRVLPQAQVLEGLGPRGGEVLTRLTRARLVTVRKARAGADALAELELAHESLISAWDRLARWIEESQDDLVFLSEVSQSAELWERRGRRDEEVWEGDALHEASRTLERCTTPVPALVTRFLEAGHLKEQRLTRRKRVRLIAGVASAMVVLGVIAVVALIVAVAFSTKEGQARKRLAVAHREGAQAALTRGDVLEARAKLRSSLETLDSPLARALWWRLLREPLVWKKELTSFIYEVAFSPDGRTVAAACQDKSIYLLDVKSQALRVLRGHNDQVFCLAFSPDGRSLASGTWSGKVRVWDLEGDTVKVLGGHTEAVWGVRFHPKGKLLASVSYDKTTRIWDLASGAKTRILRGHQGRVRSLSFSPDGAKLATAAYDNVIRVWDLASGRQLHELSGHTNRIYSVAYTPDGKRLLSGSLDRTLRLWDLRLHKPTSRILVRHDETVYGLSVRPDGRHVAFGSGDKTVQVVEIITGRRVKVLRGHTDRAYSVAYSPDGRRIVSGSMDKTIRLWDLSSSEPPPVAVGHTSAVFGTALSPDGKLVASGSYDQSVRIWDVASGRQLAVLNGHESVIYNVAFAPDSKTLASSSLDKTVRLWDLKTFTLDRVLVGHPSGVTDVAFAPDGKTLASTGWDHNVRLWNPATGVQLGPPLTGHTDRVMVVRISPDGRLAASAGTDRTIRIWDLKTRRAIRTLEGHTGGIYGVAFSPNGKRLISAGLDKTIRSWDLASGRGEVLRRTGSRPYWLAIHPDGNHFGTPLSEGVARIWEIEGEGEIVLRGHRSEVNVFGFSKDGKLAVTSSDDQTVRLWEAATGRPFWRAPLLLASRPQILTHQGWTRLGRKAPEGWPPRRAWRKAVEQRAHLAVEAPGGRTLCVWTHEGQLELWDMHADKRAFGTEVPGLDAVLALPGRACVTLGEGSVRIYNAGGAYKELRTGAQAIALDQGQVLVAAGAEVAVYGPDGALKGSHKAGVGVKAMVRVKDLLALGFSDGNIELVPMAAGKPRPSFSFEGIPSSSVVRMLEGPLGTLIVGYANGFLGIWNLQNGALLSDLRLHGPVVHLLLKKNRLYVATELGHHHVLDLDLFFRPYCAVLQEVWGKVPTVWEGGLPVLRTPPAGHACAAK
jgi:WD40 repeat protein/serine/threonine protein kinase